MGKRFIWVLASLACAGCWAPSTANAQTLFSTKYDADIEEAAKLYLPMWDWRQLKAQYIQESRLDPNAVSPVGAQGICQAMPGTWTEITRELRWGAISPFVARNCILGGAYYMQKMRYVWRAPVRTEPERHQLALASYNAGAGSIIKAQRICKNAPTWDMISVCLPQVTGRKNTTETVTYVTRIGGWYAKLVAGL